MAEEKIIPEVENEELEDTTLEEAEVDEEALEETTDEGEEGEEGGEEETLYTQEQVENAVKTRVSTFNRKLEKMKGYETTVKKIGEITGMSPEALLTRLQGMSDAEQAKILGITPQQFALRRQATEATRTANENTMKLQRQLDEQKLLSDPKYKDYPLYKEEVLELMDDNPKLSIKQAYTLAKGDKGTQAAVRDAEQRAVAKMTKSSNQRVVKPGVTPGKTALKIDAATIAAAKKVGMDPAEYAAYSNISTLDDFERMKSSKKG
jgi:hypothetical protein